MCLFFPYSDRGSVESVSGIPDIPNLCTRYSDSQNYSNTQPVYSVQSALQAFVEISLSPGETNNGTYSGLPAGA